MRVVLQASTLRSSGTSIVGVLGLEGPDGHYPSDDWHDHPLVVLTWWVNGLAGVASGRANSFQGLFMSGAYSFLVQRSAKGASTVSWGSRGAEQLVGIVNVAALLSSAVEAARVVVRFCSEHQLGNPEDVQELELAIARSAG